MKRQRRKLTAQELKSITTPDLVRRVIRPTRKPRTDEEVLEEIHEQDVARRHEDEDLYWKGSQA